MNKFLALLVALAVVSGAQAGSKTVKIVKPVAQVQTVQVVQKVHAVNVQKVLLAQRFYNQNLFAVVQSQNYATCVAPLNYAVQLVSPVYTAPTAPVTQTIPVTAQATSVAPVAQSAVTSYAVACPSGLNLAGFRAAFVLNANQAYNHGAVSNIVIGSRLFLIRR